METRATENVKLCVDNVESINACFNNNVFQNEA